MKTNLPADPVWNHPVTVADIPEDGEDVTLAPDEETRAALARFADVIAVPALSARLHLQPDGAGGAVVTGELNATVKQNSVVSLEPFDNKVHEEIALRFAPEGAAPTSPDPDIELDEPDPSDAIKDGMIDLGAVVSEFLVLGIDPYPRKPGEVFTPPESGAAGKRDNPFAALEKLKKKGRSSD
ncbi:MAG TPA: DUF177 domain-containing protein [Xanthobacteraceae bacterium]|nr:DUF177 domain-containing protein [Xanthobacteraceae bacterium]